VTPAPLGAVEEAGALAVAACALVAAAVLAAAAVLVAAAELPVALAVVVAAAEEVAALAVVGAAPLALLEVWPITAWPQAVTSATLPPTTAASTARRATGRDNVCIDIPFMASRAIPREGRMVGR
jgi:hypothetical protein